VPSCLVTTLKFARRRDADRSLPSIWALERSPSLASSAVPAAVVPDAIFAAKVIAILEDDPAITGALTGPLREWGATQ
jgi:hypothetical protein